MPWIETEPMNEKIKFISAYLNSEEGTFQALCERFKISCKTGYKYINRYIDEGPDGLKERSRAPHNPANKMASHLEESILNVKHHYPSWGAKKIRNWLMQEKSELVWPAKSTIDDLLKRNGLVRPSKRKRLVTPYTQPFALCGQANDCWSIDYKGQFLLGNQQLCYPLTVTDNFSRFLLAVEGSDKISGTKVKKILTNLFLEFGLPCGIRSDNGAPFASQAIAGLSNIICLVDKIGYSA